MKTEIADSTAFSVLLESRLRDLTATLSDSSIDDLGAELTDLVQILNSYRRNDELLEGLLDPRTRADQREQIQEALSAQHILVSTKPGRGGAHTCKITPIIGTIRFVTGEDRSSNLPENARWRRIRSRNLWFLQRSRRHLQQKLSGVQRKAHRLSSSTAARLHTLQRSRQARTSRPKPIL
jgi:hypothetical protein